MGLPSGQIDGFICDCPFSANGAFYKSIIGQDVQVTLNSPVGCPEFIRNVPG